ncbi:MAG: TRAP transporter small permease subunit [Rhodospirillaceae bacterium]|nr:TRAP transporter small permease subunit [Rhodospirillaceae bacterium]
MSRAIALIDGLVAWIARPVKYLILIMIGLIMVEIFSRLIFNQSFAWTREIASWLGAAIIFLGGAYTLQEGSFVRVDIIHGRLPPKAKALVDMTIGTVCFGMVAYVLLHHGGQFAYRSLRVGETSSAGLWDGPVWAVKILIPIGSALIALAWISHFLKCLQTVLGSPQDHITQADFEN